MKSIRGFLAIVCFAAGLYSLFNGLIGPGIGFLILWLLVGL